MTARRLPLALATLLVATLLASVATADHPDQMVSTGKYDVFSDYRVLSLEQALEGHGYACIQRDEEAIKTPGARVAGRDDAHELFPAENASITVLNHQPAYNAADGYVVRINDRLEFRVLADDFEFEFELAHMYVHYQEGEIWSVYWFVAAGDGVAHNVRVQALVDGRIVHSTDLGPIESRANKDHCAPESSRSTQPPPSGGTQPPLSLGSPVTTCSCPTTSPSTTTTTARPSNGTLVPTLGPPPGPVGDALEYVGDNVPGGWPGLGLGLVGLGTIGVAAKAPGLAAARRTLFALPLFSRLQRHQALDHPVRSRIVDAVEQDPGIHFHELQRRLGVSRGALEHHLRKLVLLGHVVAAAGPHYTCYFPKVGHGAAEMAAAGVLKAPGAIAVLAYAAAHPGCTIGDVCRATGMSASGVHFQLQRLKGAGLVALETVGLTHRLRATTQGVAQLRRVDA